MKFNARTLDQYFKEQKCVDTVFSTLSKGGVQGNPINMMMSWNIRHFERLTRKKFAKYETPEDFDNEF